MSTAILLAHMDDEVFIVPYLDQVSRNKSQVQFFYLTKSEGRNEKFSQDIRERESINFLRAYFPDCDIFFLGRTVNIRDRELHLNLIPAYHEIKKLIAPSTQLIISPHFEGGHIDHDSAAFLAKALARSKGINAFTFSLYRALFSKLAFFEVSSSREKKSDSVKVKHTLRSVRKISKVPLIYKSQWRTWLGIYPFLLLKSVTIRKVWLFNSDHIDHKFIPNSGKVLYSNRKDGIFEEWKSSIDQFLESI